MLITWVTTVSSSGRDDNAVIKISHGMVVKMTTKIFTVQSDTEKHSLITIKPHK